MVYRLKKHKAKESLPILVSVPHAGTLFPEELMTEIFPHFIEKPEDTDWFVDEIYGFASLLGVDVLSARFSRYVIDLNRNPDDISLYSDGRRITTLLPTETFGGEPLYRREPPDHAERQRRREKYYDPYHNMLQSLLDDLVEKFGFALLIEGHSIKRRVPSISEESFPDIMLGNNEGRTCSQGVFEAAAKTLSDGGYNVALNHPFKGGYITRSFHDAEKKIQTLQIEMSQDLYIDELSLERHDGFKRLHDALKHMIIQIVEELR